MKKGIELLAPARNVETGIEAIRHGADAVYIGATEFGARSAACNEIADIERLCIFAHIYGAKVYVAMNTILYDHELEKARQMVWKLYEAGVDALIVQDMAYLKMDLPPIPLHASTQCDIRTAEKAQFLEQAGFEQLVLARELSLEQIQTIHEKVQVPLEAFVHGALCVSYSGQCYASQYLFQRSANRGCCAQFCRLPFDLLDAEHHLIVADQHLLSLCDMNRSDYLQEMMEAGVQSFKIEGRLKDISYVKNITAYYRQRIDQILDRPEMREKYYRSSFGKSSITFTPNPYKSFNRGFTDYLLLGSKKNIHQFISPKSKGEPVGFVTQVKKNSFFATAELHPGDGICFIGKEEKLLGFRVNNVKDNEIFPATMPPLRPGDALFRNHDQEFESVLSKPSAVRRLNLALTLTETEQGYQLSAKDETGRSVSAIFEHPHEDARTPQLENLQRQFSKLGDTPFELQELQVHLQGNRFIPSSKLSNWKRDIVDKLLQQPLPLPSHPQKPPHNPAGVNQFPAELTYLANVSNRASYKFYTEKGAMQIQPAYELQTIASTPIMFCKHCIKYAYGQCPKQSQNKNKWKEPLSLRISDGRTFPITFDCKNCQMIIYAPAQPS